MGPWGSGKSSVINMMLEEYRNLQGAEETITIEYNPWRIPEGSQLSAHFLSALSQGLGRRNNSDLLKKAAGRLNKIAATLRVLKYVPHVGEQASSLERAVRVASEQTEKLAEDVGTLDALRAEVSGYLTQEHRRILVTLDDIDRLEPDEARQMLRLVKAFGDLPFVTYVVAYDRSALLRALDNANPKVGALYLEKVVTFQVDLPPVEESLLDDLFLSDLKAVLMKPRPPHIDEQRILELYTEAVRRYVKTPRDMNRLLNAFFFAYGALRKDVDIGDLLGLVTLQLFEPSVVDSILRDPSLYADTIMAIVRGDQRRPSENKSRLEAELDMCKPKDKGAALEVLRHLFPRVENAYRAVGYSISTDDAERACRISADKTFARYFLRTVTSVELSRAGFESILDLAKGEATSDLLARLDVLGADRAGSFIELAGQQADFRQMTEHECRLLLRNAFEIGGHVFPGNVCLPFDSMGHGVITVVRAVLRPYEPSPDVWTETLVQAMRDAPSAFSPMVACAHYVARRREGSDSGIYAMLSEEHFAQIRAAAVTSAELALRQGRLKSDPQLFATLSYLKQFDSSVAERVADEAASDVEVAMAMLTSSKVISSQFTGWLIEAPGAYWSGRVRDLLGGDRFLRMTTLIGDLALTDETARAALTAFLRDVDRDPTRHYDDDTAE